MRSNHNRLRYILTALMMTAILAIVVRTLNDRTLSPALSPAMFPAITPDNRTVQSLQAQNDQLRQLLEQMQAREKVYRSQIEKANTTILQLIEQPEPASPTLSSLQTENRSLRQRISLLEEQIQQLQAPQQGEVQQEQEENEQEGG